MTYVDTSALIKRFVAEKGSGVVQTIIRRNGPIATAKIAYVEVFAGLTRKRREGHLSASQYAYVCRQFERDWQAYIRIDLLDPILLLARDLIRRHPLRGFDAVHLASAVTLKHELGEHVVFAAADEQLLRAAKAAKLGTLNVEKARTPLSLT